MREHRDHARSPLIPPPSFLPDLQPSSLGLLSSSSSPANSTRDRIPEIRVSPFKSFLTPNPTSELPPPPSINILPLAAHQAATVGLSREQKQILWTWSLSFQCVVNVGVRGSELVRTRVVEAGVVPVIISVLGGYLHEMERIRQQSEARERARRKSTLLLASQPTASISALSRSLSPADIPRPPRPVLSPRTLLNPQSRPTQNLLPTTSPTRPLNPSGLAASAANARPSPPRLSLTGRRNSMAESTNNTTNPQPSTSQHHHPSHNHPPSQLSARSDGSGTFGSHPTIQSTINPISINSSTHPGFRTGSISPSSVSSSSSLETSRLLSGRLSQAQHHLVRSVTPDTLQSSIASGSGSGSEVEMDDQPITATSVQAAGDGSGEVDPSDQMDAQPPARFDADESEADVVMELAGDSSEPGPSNLDLANSANNSRRRTRRGTIKGTHRGSVVQITPLGPPPTTVTDFEDRSLSNSSASETGPTSMEGIESSALTGVTEANMSPNANRPTFNDHQTPRASSTRLTSTPHTITQRSLHPDSRHEYAQSSAPSDTDDVTMAGPSDRNPSRGSLTNILNPSPPRHLPPGPRPEDADNQTLAGARLQRIFSETGDEDPPPAFTAHSPPATEPTMIPIPITITNPGTPPVPVAAVPVVPVAPIANPMTNTGSTATLGFRDEDVLLALQLLAYLSKYPHVRAYFHEPASRATLELTYGSMMEATRALARFVGRYKSDRYERERAKEAIIALGGGPNTTPTASTSNSRRSASAQLPSDWAAGTAPLPGAFTTPPANRTNVPSAHGHGHGHGHQVAHAHLHRATTSTSATQERLNRAEAYVRAFSTREPIYTAPPPADREHSTSGTHSSLPTMASPAPMPGIHYAPSPSLTMTSSYARMTTGEQINPLSTNVFSYVERFTHRRPSNDNHTPIIPSEIQYWAGVIMRNACRKDEERGGIRQCANMQCGKWETYPREFAKCRRCRKAKYCSKACQSKAWQLGHRFWCCTKSDYETATDVAAAAAAASSATTTTTTEVVPTGTQVEAERPDTPTANTPVGDDPSTGTTTPAPVPIVPVAPIRPLPEPAGLMDAAIARLRRRRSTISLVTADRGAEAIATPPDQETGLGIGRVNVGLVVAAANPLPLPEEVEDEGNRARRIVEEEAEQEDEAIRLANPVNTTPRAL
ncbi:hypothetical protein CROQUDRAFT_670962 [Cronartium quercuum f. sp. fusiforme G11]|uniref:MYND-type domain-containing protein n=1 Tax=Cronartium quercuum f. sp. fusiforme G11 TaxID=708437 RepID=A0A9P6NMD7_9BASI|nr:hypothetical protein CROQUDRAFT_670962 [Cronartium quercuum f. sp. fusiforme G11]